MMKLTGTEGVELVNPLRVVTVRGWDEDDDDHAVVVCAGSTFRVVRETPEEVAEEFQAATADGTYHPEHELALRVIAANTCGGDCAECTSASSCNTITARVALGITDGGIE